MGNLFELNTSDWQFWFWIIVTIILLYIARPYMHRLLKSVFFGAAHFFGRSASWFSGIGARGYERYCETVSAHAAEEYEQKLRNHQTRLTRRVERYDTEIFGVLDKLEESSQRIDGCVDTLKEINLPQSTVETVRATFSQEGDAKITTKINKAVSDVKRVVSSQVQSVRPTLTSIKGELKPIGQSVTALRETSNEFGRLADRVNSDMETFEAVVTSSNRIAVAQKQSIVIPWILSLLVMTIALSGVFLNYFLIERPMAEIVGDGVRVAGMSLPAAAALVVIFLEAVAGVVLMDAAGLTKLTPISNTSGKLSKTLFWTAIGFLVTFSIFEAMLAIQREVIISAEACVEATAAGLDCAAESEGISLTMLAQMLLAIMIPWLLAIAVVPLETLVQNSTFIVRIALHQIVMLTAYLFKTLATMLRAFGVFILRLYDLIVFLPLAIEQMVRNISKMQDKAK